MLLYLTTMEIKAAVENNGFGTGHDRGKTCQAPDVLKLPNPITKKKEIERRPVNIKTIGNRKRDCA